MVINNSILIVGGDSTIGSSLMASFEADCIPTWQTTHQHKKVNDRCLFLDLSEDVSKWQLPPKQIKTAILCAAITNQELCRLDPELSWRVNVRSTVALATRMIDAGVFVIFLSSLNYS